MIDVSKVTNNVAAATVGAVIVVLGNLLFSPIGIKNDLALLQQTVAKNSEMIEYKLVSLENDIKANSAGLMILKDQVRIGTEDRIKRSEWYQDKREQEKRLLHLERYAPDKSRFSK